MRSLVFEGGTWGEYENIRQNDRKKHKILCRVIKEMLRGNPGVGGGKPERLKHNLSGSWSRRISDKDRIVYKYNDDAVYILAIGGHYD